MMFTENFMLNFHNANIPSRTNLQKSLSFYALIRWKTRVEGFY